MRVKTTLAVRMALALGMGAISAGFGDAAAVGLVWETNLSAPPAPGTERLPAIADTPVERAIALRASQLAPGPWGDYYYFALDATGRTSISRLSGTDDAMVWHGSVSGFVPWAGGQVLDGQSLPDGSVQAVLGGIARFSASGQLLWSRAVGVGSYAPEPARVLYRSDGDALIAKQAREYPSTSLPTVARVDASTGAAVSARAIAGTPGSSCDIAWVAVGTDEAAYLTQACRRAGSDTRDYSLARLAEDFSSVWTVELPAGVTLDAPYEARGVADGAGVYMVEGSAAGASLVKRSAADGAVLWRLAGDVDRLSIDAAGRLLAIDAMDDAYRLTVVDAASGQALWTQVQAGRDPVVDTAADALYVAATDVSQGAGFLERRDPATGTLQWRKPIAAAVAGRTFRPRDVLASGSSVRISGSDCLPFVACASALVRLDAGDGQIRAYRWPDVAQSLVARWQSGDDGTLLISSLERGEGTQQVHVRQVDQDGIVMWERVFPIDTPLTLQEGHAQWTGDGDILISANTGRIDASVAGFPYLAKYSRSGALRWQRLLTQGEQQRGASFRADSDADGDVYVSVSIALAQAGGQGYLSARSLMRLDAATGEPAWTVPFRELEGLVAPPAFDRVQQGLLIFEPALTMVGDGVSMLSLADGSVRWRNTDMALRAASLLTAADGVGYLQAFGEIHALSLADGSQVWTYRYAPVAGEAPQFTVADVGAGGDLFVGGLLAGAQSSGVALRLAGGDGSPRWINRFAESAGMSSDRIVFVRLEERSLGLVQVSNGKQLWTRLDRDDGRFLDSSVLTLRSTFDEALAFRGGAVGPRTPDGGMLAYGEAYWPGRPRTAWIGRLAAPDAGTRGNLAVSLSVTPLADATNRFALTAQVSYSGDDPLGTALAYVRWTAAEPNTRAGDALIATDPACQVIGTGQCRLTPTPAGLRVELEALAPGSAARITAALTRIADADGVSIEAFGPYGLFETDMRDNRAVDSQVWDLIFRDAFE